MKTASESAGRQIRNRNLITKSPQTSILYHFKGNLVNPTSVRFQIGFTAKAPNNYVKSEPSHRKTAIFPAKERSPKKQKYQINH